MTSTELIILNFEEVRRRSIKLWTGIPEKFYSWQPDQNAMTIIEMVQHVLESEYIYHTIINNRGTKGDSFKSPWENKDYATVLNEIKFAQPYRLSFLEMVRSLSEPFEPNRNNPP